MQFGAGLLVQGSAVKVRCVLSSLGAGVAAGSGWCLWQCGRCGVLWRLRLFRSKKGEYVVATKKYLLLSGVFAGVIFYILYIYIIYIHMYLCICTS